MNIHWGSRLTLSRDRELMQVIDNLHIYAITTRESTYWPSDSNKISDLIDFDIAKDTSKFYIKCKSCLELSSNHPLVLITVNSQIVVSKKL